MPQCANCRTPFAFGEICPTCGQNATAPRQPGPEPQQAQVVYGPPAPYVQRLPQIPAPPAPLPQPGGSIFDSLKNALAGHGGQVRGTPALQRALNTVCRSAGPRAVTVLIKLLSDPDSEVRIAAARCLESMGPAAGAAIVALQLASVAPDTAVAAAARQALAQVLGER